MKLGLQIPNFSFPEGPAAIAPTLGQIAAVADQAGLTSLWVMDHFYQIDFIGPAHMDMLEGYTTLGFLAARTHRIKLGTLVTGVTYRHPGVLVKTVTTLDVLSGGRAYLGIGAAWYEREHRGLGVPFPPLAERFERLEETLQIALHMWSGQTGPYQGRHYQLAEGLNVPQPLSRPHPPIMIGGMGEKKTLRLVARYAQACNLFLHAGREALAAKLEVLRRHCEAEGRPYEDIEKTVLGTLNLRRDGRQGSKSVQQALDELAWLAELGIDHAIFNIPEIWTMEGLDLLCTEVWPVASRLAVAGRPVASGS